MDKPTAEPEDVIPGDMDDNKKEVVVLAVATSLLW